MADIKHHLNDALLMGYSAGTLPEAFNLVVASHISMCDECRARMHSFDALGGVVLEEQSASVEMSEGALQNVLALINDGPVEPIQARPNGAAQEPCTFPAPLREYVGGDLDAVRWKSLGGGVKQAVLNTSKDATVRLLKIPGGSAMPDHGHRGTELTLILQGAFSDEEDRFGRGDIEIANEDLHHSPVAEMGVDCICLAATDAPLKFNSLIPRIAQPFLRI